MNPANHSQPQGSGKEPPMNATSGPTSGQQFAYYDPDSHSLRMWPATGLWGSIRYSQTVPPTGYMSDGRVYERQTSEHPTTVSGSSFSYLPTPAASDWKRNDHPADRRRKSPAITTVTRYWPGLVEPPTSATKSDSDGETPQAA